MKIETLVLGTSNKGKLKEWRKVLAEEGFKGRILPVSEFGEISDPDETGETFEDNAKQKATYYAEKTKHYVLSEDGGYEIDALGGAPGVRSRRILPGDKEGSDDQLIDYVLNKVKGLEKDKRGVSLTCAVAVSNPKGNIIYEDGEKFRGLISKKRGPVQIPGYPFRSIHYLPEQGKTYAELTPEEHHKISHKRKVAKRFVEFLERNK